MKSERGIDGMKREAKQRISQILKDHGLSTWKKAGLRRSLEDALVMTALRGEIS